MATLIGYAVPLNIQMPGLNQMADHTYVRTSDGRGVWGCWGRNSGGRQICSGRGSSNSADCISKPWSTAGLIYAVTGVCHQTANRILYPAGAIVSQANGYWISSLLYGTYGTGPSIAEWPLRRGACYWSRGDKSIKSVPKATETKEPAVSQDKGEKTYAKQVIDLYTTAAAKSPEMFTPKKKGETPNILTKEMELMVNFRLGKGFDSSKTNDILNLKSVLHKEKQKLDDALYSEELNAEDYANKINKLVNTTLKHSAKTLGSANHKRLFGVSHDVNFILVDPNIAIKVHGHKEF